MIVPINKKYERQRGEPMNEAWSAALKVISKLEDAGYEAVIVGGAVRDQLLGRPFSDVDVATSALPEEVKNIFEKTIDVGIAHGTVLVLDECEPIEVTTYRTESTYSDFRHPDKVKFVRNLKEDMQRRDFTMNAMAIRADGDIVDYFGGTDDLKRGVIRAVGDANERFSEDALRMLRAIRFVAQLGFDLHIETAEAIHMHGQLIKEIAVERVVQEFDKLFVGEHVGKAMEMMERLELNRWLPGNFDAIHWEIACPENADVGWAYFCFVSQESAQEELLQVYKCSNARKSFVKHVIELATIPIENWSVKVIFSYMLEELLAANRVKYWANLNYLAEDDLSHKKNNLPIQSQRDLVVNGRDLLEWNGGKRGPWVKEHLDEIVTAVLFGDIKNDYNAIKEWYDAKFNER